MNRSSPPTLQYETLMCHMTFVLPGTIHHVIQYIHPEGPVGRQQLLREGDEILEVNGVVLVSLQHDQAIEVIRDTPDHVRMVVCSRQPPPPTETEAGEHTYPLSKSDVYTCIMYTVEPPRTL